MIETDPADRLQQPPVSPLAHRPKAFESLVVASMLPFLRPVRFIAIFALPIIILVAITYCFPAANFLGAVFPQAGIGIGGPISAAANYGLIGIVVWLASALLISFAAATWSIEIAIGARLPLSTVIRTGIGRAIHYFAASFLAFTVPTIPIILLMYTAGMSFTPGQFEFSLHEPRAWLFGAALILAFATLWVICRLLLLGAVVALCGWRGALVSAWGCGRGLTLRFVFLIALTGVIIFVADAVMARTIVLGQPLEKRLHLFTGINMLNLGASLIFVILVTGILAAHLPLDRLVRPLRPDQSH